MSLRISRQSKGLQLMRLTPHSYSTFLVPKSHCRAISIIILLRRKSHYCQPLSRPRRVDASRRKAEDGDNIFGDWKRDAPALNSE